MVKMNQMEQVLIGSILGDGSIGKTGAYQEGHCVRQKDYLLWKKRILDKQFDKSKIRYYEKPNCYQIYIPKNSIFQEYREISYPDGKKIVSNKFIKRIGKLAICIWYFDDGSYNPQINRIKLCSYGFSYEENKKLQNMLKNKFGWNFFLYCYKRKSKNLYYLVCNGKDTDKFLDFIKKNTLYIPKSMTYKMGKLDKCNLEWIEEKKESFKRSQKKYVLQNRKLIYKRQKKWRDENKEHYRKHRNIYRKEYRKNNLEKVREMARKYYQIKRKRRGVCPIT
jgi:hypothetical protein